MSEVAQPFMTPWQELWVNRLRKPPVLLLAGLALGIGLPLTISDRVNWIEIGANVLFLELIVVLLGAPRAGLSSSTLTWMRRFGLRMLVFGSLAATLPFAALAKLGAREPTVLNIGIVFFAVSGLSAILGGQMLLWSFLRQRKSATDQSHSLPGVNALVVIPIGWAAYESFMRVQRTGVLEAVRIVGLALVVVGAALALFRHADEPSLADAT